MTNFVSTWNTANTSTGSSNADQIKLPLEAAGTYNFTVNWGDGNEDIITTYNQAEVTHTYVSSNNYEITISGTIYGFRFNNGGDKLKILNITNWGNLRLGNSNGYFRGCSNLNVGAVDTLDLTGTTTLRSAFDGCLGLTTLNTSNWNTSSITSFQYAFQSCSSLTTLDTSSWDTSSVTTFNRTFKDCSSLTTLNTSNWNVTSLTDATTIFYGVTLTTESYDSLLNNFAPQLLQSAVPFHGGYSKYSYEAIDARKYLISQYGWTIEDGGQSDDVQPAWFMNWIAQSYAAERNYSHNPDDVIDPSDAVGAWGTAKESTTKLVDLSGNGNIADIHGAMPAEGFIQGRRFTAANGNYLDCGNDLSIRIGTNNFISTSIVRYNATQTDVAPLLCGAGTKHATQWMVRILDEAVMFYGHDGTMTVASTTNIKNSKIHIVSFARIDDNLYCYVDGVLEGTTSGVLGVNLNTSLSYTIASNASLRKTDGKIYFNSLILSGITSTDQIQSVFNTIARLPFWSVNYTDYPDNVTEYTDRLPYSSSIISSGTFKVDDDKLQCVSAGTMTYSASYKFDGSEYIKVEIDGVEYAGTGTITQGNTTVAITQDSNKVTIQAGTGDTINRINIQFRKEV